MAHFKYKRPRAAAGGTYSANGLKNRLGPRHDDHRVHAGTPRFHDKLFHIRPTRRQCRRLERLVLKGCDPECLTWPLGRKPHVYYW